MRILIIRHGDPNYEIDSLTEKGWREAELLEERLKKTDIKEFYVSPLGRARDTASITLKALGREGVVKDWMQEFFKPQIEKPNKEGRSIVWDWMPADWTGEPRYYDRNQWMDTDIMRDSTVAEEYHKVCTGLDELLAEYGYERDGNLYHVKKANRDTIALICHFGVECVMLSHLLGVSPMVLWHGFIATPTSVTTLISEERQEGIASFRVNAFADVSHLYVADEPPAFHGRFCETFDCDKERH